MRKSIYIVFGVICFSTQSFAQFQQHNPGSNHGNKFEQLETILKDPNSYRSASGAPGPKYWQQKADYEIVAEIDDKNQILNGSEVITYTNNSPDILNYLWLQLDENQHKAKNDNELGNTSSIREKLTEAQLQSIIGQKSGLGVNIKSVTDFNKNPLSYTINNTMMRIDLPKPLLPNEKFKIAISWNYNISDRDIIGGRGGYEYFSDDDNYLYTITQWYPRMAVYSDFQGWQNKQFTGGGEFALSFGDFNVQITVPSDHIVGATGECQNYATVLSPMQLKRWQLSQNATEPIEIVTLNEVNENLKHKSAAKKTWNYKAENVRDFAFVSSRRLVWDAMRTKVDGGKNPMAMSYYGPEAYGLYHKYSTKLVAHTLKVYSKHTIPYPYPVAISVEAANGMEYPMICFNYGRTEKDGTYSEAIKYGMMSVIIHEVGHNFFPMIINTDERQWTWMDEGLNTFCQFLAEQEWDSNYPSKRGNAFSMIDYMRLPKEQLEPIMTNSENINQFGANAYGKPATALNILRETVMGRSLFDFAFKEYAKRWAFKHPTPTDFFRTMEDASAVDLDWFWRGWFYGTDAVDISLESVKSFDIDAKNLVIEKSNFITSNQTFSSITKTRNKAEGIKTAIEKDSTLKDFYDKWREEEMLKKNRSSSLTDTFQKKADANKEVYFYQLDFANKGGLVSPIIIEWTFNDGSKQVDYLPAYIWRKDETKASKVFAKTKEVVSVRLDPYRETADIDESNNYMPRVSIPTKIELFKQQQKSQRGASTGGNPMQSKKKN